MDIGSLSALQTVSEREAQVLFYLVRGYSAKMIAATLNLSPRTVEGHCTNLKDKFNATSKPDLINKAFELGYHLILPIGFLDQNTRDPEDE